MNTRRLFQLAPTALLLAGTAAAQGIQNVDVAVLIGPVPSHQETVSAQIPAGTSVTSLGSSGSVVAQGTGISVLITFGYQLHASKVADLYLDLPAAWKLTGNATVTQNSVVALSTNTFYFTPGLRVKFNVHPRLALFVVGGAGVGTVANYTAQVVNGSVLVNEDRPTKPVGEIGAGLDFRLTKLLSLRVEEREFVRSDHATGIFGVGLGFHF